jgi:hypothetical protein
VIEPLVGLLPWLGVPLLWLLCALLAWVGVVRHSYRAWLARRELRVIRQAGVNGGLRWAAETNAMGEWCRLWVKAGLLALALLRLNVQWERLDVLAPEWDWRDVVQPLLYLCVLLLLTHWSNWEAGHRPTREAST